MTAQLQQLPMGRTNGLDVGQVFAKTGPDRTGNVQGSSDQGSDGRSHMALCTVSEGGEKKYIYLRADTWGNKEQIHDGKTEGGGGGGR